MKARGLVKEVQAPQVSEVSPDTQNYLGGGGNTRKADKGKATETLFCSSHDSDKKKLTGKKKKKTLLQREDTLLNQVIKITSSVTGQINITCFLI